MVAIFDGKLFITLLRNIAVSAVGTLRFGAMRFDRLALVFLIFHSHSLLSASLVNDVEAPLQSPLEDRVTSKLKVGTRVKHNLGKILHEIPRENHRIYYSVKVITDYLRNGGSLLECLDVLPSLAYVPIDEQIDGLLASMEDHLPKYLIPAISLIRKSISQPDGVLNTDEIYRPDFGPLKIDLFDRVQIQDVKQVAMPLLYREKVKSMQGPWPKILGVVASLIHRKIIFPRRELIGYMLANLKIPDAVPEVRESVAHLTEELQVDGARITEHFRTSSDPYQLVKNAISSMTFYNESLLAARTLVPYLRIPQGCGRTSELQRFFQNDTLNYTLLISHDEKVAKSKAGKDILSMIHVGGIDLRQFMESFYPFEYSSWRNLLQGFIGKLRRYKNLSFVARTAVNSIYGDLLVRTGQKQWQLLRNEGIMQVILSEMGRREKSVWIRRLLADVGYDRSVPPKKWRYALIYGVSKDISGPVDAALRTLKALLKSNVVVQKPLKTAIDELVTFYDKRKNKSQQSCAKQLDSQLADYPQMQKQDYNKTIRYKDVDIKDLLQAAPLDIYSHEYVNLNKYLSDDNLEKNLGVKINIQEHPTRGRLLSWILQKIENSDNFGNPTRELAKEFSDVVSYEGYGAAGIALRS